MKAQYPQLLWRPYTTNKEDENKDSSVLLLYWNQKQKLNKWCLKNMGCSVPHLRHIDSETSTESRQQSFQNAISSRTGGKSEVCVSKGWTTTRDVHTPQRNIWDILTQRHPESSENTNYLPGLEENLKFVSVNQSSETYPASHFISELSSLTGGTDWATFPCFSHNSQTYWAFSFCREKQNPTH